MAVDPKMPRMSDQIDENLRRVYDELLKEDVPDHLKQLLARLREKDREK